jgi:hypothetical protein
MIDIRTTRDPRAVSASVSANAAAAVAAMRATDTNGVFRSIAMAWPPVTEVVDRLTFYISDQIHAPGSDKPLLHVALRRFSDQLGDWQQTGLTTEAIRHALAAMLVSVRELSRIEAWRGEFKWDPCLGVSFTEFAQGKPIRIVDCSDQVESHPDDILRVVGNYVLTPAALLSLSRDLRKLIREYEASCQA